MELGVLFAILTAISHALSGVLVRRGTYKAEESFTATAISLFVGGILCAIVLPLSGEWKMLETITWQGFALLSAGGIVQFNGARYCVYSCNRILGANKSTAVIRLNALFAVIFGITFLHETVTLLLVLGALIIMTGATVANLEWSGEKGFNLPTKGVLFGLGAAILTAAGGALIRAANVNINAPFATTFVSYTTSVLVLVIIFMFSKQQRNRLFQLPRPSKMILSGVGVVALVANLFRFAALSYSPLSVVQPIMGTNPLFTFLFSFMINRKIDIFSWRVFTGILLAATGVFLISAS
ncbi:DMT family transporter [Chloroflexota bacterium]